LPLEACSLKLDALWTSRPESRGCPAFPCIRR